VTDKKAGRVFFLSIIACISLVLNAEKRSRAKTKSRRSARTRRYGVMEIPGSIMSGFAIR
jgi:hypothetical protein